MKDNENINEINMDQLEGVSGGTSPRYPTGVDYKPAVKSKMVLNSIFDNLNKATTEDKFVKPFEVCPKCQSTAVSFNRVENICMCQDCGYCEDRSK